MSEFKSDKCGMTNIDCGKEGYKTPRKIELEKKLQIAEEALNNIYFFDCDICKNLKFKCDDKCDGKVDKIVEQALQKMKEVNNDK